MRWYGETGKEKSQEQKKKITTYIPESNYKRYDPRIKRTRENRIRRDRLIVKPIYTYPDLKLLRSLTVYVYSYHRVGYTLQENRQKCSTGHVSADRVLGFSPVRIKKTKKRVRPSIKSTPCLSGVFGSIR